MDDIAEMLEAAGRARDNAHAPYSGFAVGACLASDDGRERIVALAEYVRLRDPASAEIAFTVADELQGRGVATRLL